MCLSSFPDPSCRYARSAALVVETPSSSSHLGFARSLIAEPTPSGQIRFLGCGSECNNGSRPGVCRIAVSPFLPEPKWHHLCVSARENLPSQITRPRGVARPRPFPMLLETRRHSSMALHLFAQRLRSRTLPQASSLTPTACSGASPGHGPPPTSLCGRRACGPVPQPFPQGRRRSCE